MNPLSHPFIRVLVCPWKLITFHAVEALVGRPGSGKSFEAVANHVLPALRMGRFVVTNLPLNIGEIRALGEYYIYNDVTDGKVKINIADLIVLVHPNKRNNNIPFSVVEDFSGYQHLINDQNIGVYYVIDECHKAFPNSNALARDNATILRITAISEWFAEHRHIGADVMIITQHIQKVFKPIADNVQTLYIVSKMSNFGAGNRYRLKMFDGISSDASQVGEPRYRYYNKAVYPLYESHTASSFLGRKVVELNAFDRPRWWQNSSIWKLLAIVFVAVLLFTWAFYMLSKVSGSAEEQIQSKKRQEFVQAKMAREKLEEQLKQKLEDERKEHEKVHKAQKEHEERKKKEREEQKKLDDALRVEKLNNHPYAGYKLIYSGRAKYQRYDGKTIERTYFTVYDKQQFIANETSESLEKMGYTLLQNTWGHVKLAYLGEELPMHIIRGVPNRYNAPLALSSAVFPNMEQGSRNQTVESNRNPVKPVPQPSPSPSPPPQR